MKKNHISVWFYKVLQSRWVTWLKNPSKCECLICCIQISIGFGTKLLKWILYFPQFPESTAEKDGNKTPKALPLKDSPIRCLKLERDFLKRCSDQGMQLFSKKIISTEKFEPLRSLLLVPPTLLRWISAEEIKHTTQIVTCWNCGWSFFLFVF